MTEGYGDFVGVPPIVSVGPVNPEVSKYRRLYDMPEYKEASPGERWWSRFYDIVKPIKGSTCIDFGCGTGRGSLMIAKPAELSMTMLDFVDNGLTDTVRTLIKEMPERFRFFKHDLTKPVPYSAKYGYCTDVMEHIPPEDVPKVLKNVMAAAEQVFFTIAVQDDPAHAALIGAPLHLTIQPMEWWVEQVRKAGGQVLFAASEGPYGTVLIHCSSWLDEKNLKMVGTVNVPPDVINAQIRQNIAGGWQHVRPYPEQDTEVVLLAGGPSLEGSLPEIERLILDGGQLVTVNGAYKWALDHGLSPKGQIVLDAREFNSRFVQPVRAGTTYLMASQVHPSTLAQLPKESTYLWHLGLPGDLAEEAKAAAGYYYPVPGGCTVTLRAIPLLRMLGYKKLHIFGLDSCVFEEKHHAYEQPENDKDWTCAVSMGGKTFTCTAWHISQFREFREMIGMIGDTVDLSVYGDGLIATLLQHCAELPDEE